MAKPKPVAVLFCVACFLAYGCATEVAWRAQERVRADVRIPVVYNRAYNLYLYGNERKTMWDTHRYEKVFADLVARGIVSRQTVVVPGKVTDEELALFHTEEWIAKTHDPREVARVFEQGIIEKLPEKITFNRIVAPFRYQTRGTILAAKLALAHGIACTLGGGFAHAGADKGEGFNLFADAPLAIRSLRHDGWRGKVLLVDVDVHHGQGTARAYRDDPDVFIIDVYNRANYPRRFEKVDIPVALAPGTEDDAYIEKLRRALQEALRVFRPDLVIYVAGVDCHRDDRIGGLAITEDGLFARDTLVIDEVTRRHIPLCITLAGGYWKGSWRPSSRMIAYAATKVR